MSSGTIIENERGFPYLELTDPKSFDWGTLKPLNGKTAEAITVVIPGYSAIFETLHCIYSRICAKSRLDIRLIAIDDCSPEPDIFEQLSVLANVFFSYGDGDRGPGLHLVPGSDLCLKSSQL
jgi:hypothetical protein